MNKLFLNISAVLLLTGLSTVSVFSQKTIHLTVERTYTIPADKIWAHIAEDYGAIANSHPAVIVSNYTNESLKGGEGVERVCHFNQSGTRFLKEKMVDYNAQQRSFVNQVFQTGKFPVDPEVSKGVYKVQAMGDDSSRLTIDVYFRMKPAFMGGLMKGKMRNLMEDYLIGIEHYLKTGEKVQKKGFKKLRHQYS